jgi:hypothetical protein
MNYHITCRATEDCKADAVIYVILGCLNQHIQEIAVCERHYNYNTIYGPQCHCGKPIETNEYVRVSSILREYKRNYINSSDLNGRNRIGPITVRS